MNFSTARSERITAIVSTLVAVAILAGGVTAYQSHNAPVDDVVQLESDLRFQLEVAFRHDPNERIVRLAQLEKVSQAWLQSPRQIADREKLASWLFEATIRSMPGSVATLPSVPSFGKQSPPPVAQPKPDGLVTPPVDEEDSDVVQQVPTPVPFVATFDSELSQVDTGPTAVFESRPTSDQLLVVPTTRPQSEVAAAVPAAAPVRINLTELSARIAGYHDGLDEVETAPLALDVDDFNALAELIRQLDGMTGDFYFIQMYYEVLTDKERRAVASPRPMTTTLAEIERRLDRSQATPSGDFLEEFDSTNQKQIAVLRRQLSEVANRFARSPL